MLPVYPPRPAILAAPPPCHFGSQYGKPQNFVRARHGFNSLPDYCAPCVLLRASQVKTGCFQCLIIEQNQIAHKSRCGKPMTTPLSSCFVAYLRQCIRIDDKTAIYHRDGVCIVLGVASILTHPRAFGAVSCIGQDRRSRQRLTRIGDSITATRKQDTELT